MKYQETKMKMESNNASIDNESIDSSAMHLDPGSFGDWRSPQRSATSYVRCLLEALHYMLRSTQLEPLYVKRVGLASRTQFVRFLQHDLKYMHPDENGIKVIQMATAQLSYVAVKLATSVTKQKNKLKTKHTNKTQKTKETKETKESITKENNTEENKIENMQDAGTGGWLET